MELARWIAAVVLVVPGLWLAALNWGVFWKRHVVQDSDAPSWIPLIPGLLLTAAIAIVPLGLTKWCWIPLLVEWGAVPGIAYSIWWNVKRDA